MKALLREKEAFTSRPIQKSGQSVQAIFISIITALGQILMPYDGCAGPETVEGGCGSW